MLFFVVAEVIYFIEVSVDITGPRRDEQGIADWVFNYATEHLHQTTVSL